VFRYFAVTVTLVFLIGCGGSEQLGQVSGTVTVAGQPVTNGSIVYEDRQNSISVRVNLDEQGQYHVRTHDRDGLPPGNYQVAVTSTRVGSGASPFVGGADEQASPPPGPTIPGIYQHFSTSGLTAQIAPGVNVKDFDLD
jgi:hypothetical protein